MDKRELGTKDFGGSGNETSVEEAIETEEEILR